MNYFHEIGVTAPEHGWVPSPTFILRRAAILREIGTWEVGHVLEVGCGSGSICYDLAKRGFSCTAVETSGSARHAAQNILRKIKNVDLHETVPQGRYDYLISFEVLEHIENDQETLDSWVERLRPGGKCLISVPAHRKRWNFTDLAAGHYRRYNRDDLERLLEQSGLSCLSITTYGWPVSWFIERLRIIVFRHKLRKLQIDPEGINAGDAFLTSASGTNRDAEAVFFPIYGSWLGRKLFTLIDRLQSPFNQMDLGISFLITAQKRE